MNDQVICIHQFKGTNCNWDTSKVDLPVKGRIYTVRKTYVDPYGSNGHLFEEISTNQLYLPDGVWDNQEIGYKAERFRPIKDSTLDIFRDTTRDIEDDKFDTTPAKEELRIRP